MFKVSKLMPLFLSMVMLASCSNSSSIESESGLSVDDSETQETVLTAEEKSALISRADVLNVSYDDFTETYTVNSRGISKCPGHAIWISFKVGLDSSLTYPLIHLQAEDSVSSSIGHPQAVLVKDASGTYEYPVIPNDAEFPDDSFFCEAKSIGGLLIQANASILPIFYGESHLDDWLAYFSDASTKFRLLETYGLPVGASNYRDVDMTEGKRYLNLSALKIIDALLKSQITVDELFKK